MSKNTTEQDPVLFKIERIGNGFVTAKCNREDEKDDAVLASTLFAFLKDNPKILGILAFLLTSKEANKEFDKAIIRREDLDVFYDILDNHVD